MAITQGEDGRMWFATRSGIAVYDGLSWEVVESPRPLRLPDRAMTEWDAQANLWTLNREPPFRIHRFDGVTWSAIPEPEVTASVATCG